MYERLHLNQSQITIYFILIYQLLYHFTNLIIFYFQYCYFIYFPGAFTQSASIAG